MTQRTRRDGRGRFTSGSSGNPAGRVPGVERVRQLLEPHREDLVATAVRLALDGDTTALRLCLERLSPPPRPEGRSVVLPALETAHTLTEQAGAIMQAIAEGQVPADVGERLLAALAHVARAIEVDELASRVTALEQRGHPE